jgi:hypothetical protein
MKSFYSNRKTTANTGFASSGEMCRLGAKCYN